MTLCTPKGIGLLLALRNPNAPRSFFFHMCGACLLDWSRALMYTCIFAFPYCFWVFLKTTRVTRCCVRAFAVRFKSRSSPMVNFFFSLRHLRKISLHDMTEEPVPVVWYPVHVVRVYSPPPSTGTALKPFFSYSRTGSEKRKWQTRPNKKPHGLLPRWQLQTVV